MAPGSETHYDLLGVGRAASAEEIRAAYRHLASQYHPDRHDGNPLADLAEEKLAAANAAYEVLSDPARRAAYDADLAAGRPPRIAPDLGGAVGGLKLTLRVLAGFVALVLLMRLVPVIWRLVGAVLAPLAGTPAAPLAAIAVATLMVVLIRRRSARRGRGSHKPN